MDKIEESEAVLVSKREEIVTRHGREVIELEAKHKEEKVNLARKQEEELCEVDRKIEEKKRSRGDLEKQMQTRMKTNNSIIPECPVCLEQMRPPVHIFTCENGHAICGTCRFGPAPAVATGGAYVLERVERCTSCRTKYTGRATLVEQMIRQSLC